MIRAALALFAALIALTTPAQAQREAVLKQVDVPRNYYWREMYIPQWTSGPGSLAWSPDGSELVYVTNPETGYGTGSLWRRAVAGGEPQLVREEETS